jgi:hypothetical protein
MFYVPCIVFKQAFVVHTAKPLLLQVHVLQFCCQLVPGLQVAVQKNKQL